MTPRNTKPAYLLYWGLMALVFASTTAVAQSTSQVVFAAPSSSPPYKSAIYIANDDGSNRTQITNDNFDNVEPRLCGGNGAKVVFASNRDGHFDIWIMNTNGSGLRNLTPGGLGQVSDRKPDCKYTGTIVPMVVFRSDTDHERGEIYSVSGAEGPQNPPVRLTNDNLYDNDASWCGTDRIVLIHHEPEYPPGVGCPPPEFELQDERRRKVWVMNEDGSNLRKLTNSDEEFLTPSCSPDGQHVAFTYQDSVGVDPLGCDVPEASFIKRMPICASGPCDPDTWIHLTTGGPFNNNPTWSPGGTAIVFSSNRTSQQEEDLGTTDFEIYKMHALFGELLPPLGDGFLEVLTITPQSIDDVNPDWNEAKKP